MPFSNVVYPIKEFGGINQPNYFNIHWCITFNCSLNCWYCVLHKKEKFIIWDDCLKIINFINEQQKIRNKVYVDLFGDEVTEHPNFLDIFSALNVSHISLATNLAYETPYLNKIINLNKIKHYMVSWHYNITDSALIKRNIDLLIKHNCQFDIMLMLENKYLEDILEISKKYEHCFIVPISQEIDNLSNDIKQTIDTYNYKAKLLEDFYLIDAQDRRYVFKRAVLTSTRKHISFMNYMCDVLNHNIYIFSNGNVYPCQNYCYLRPDLFLFNILTTTPQIASFIMKKTNFKCQIDTCACISDKKFIKK